MLRSVCGWKKIPSLAARRIRAPPYRTESLEKDTGKGARAEGPSCETVDAFSAAPETLSRGFK